MKVEGIAKTPKKPRTPSKGNKTHIKKEPLWATTLALRNGCKVAEKLGVDENCLNEP